MQIIDFTEDLLTQAEMLMAENYQQERAIVNSLPQSPNFPSLKSLAKNKLTVAAVEGDVLLGYLGAYGPWEPVFCTQAVKGVFSPLHAHGAKPENRVRIYQRMYQKAAEKWVNAGAGSHAVTLYAHDNDAHEAFFQYGFGMRCMDLIRKTSGALYPNTSDYTFSELPASQHWRLRPLRKALSDHLAQSPCFMRDAPDALARWIQRREQEQVRVFVASRADQICAYIEVKDDGENFAVSDPYTQNICGAFCLPDHRGKAVAQDLLFHLTATLQSEGIMRLGVDCESFNPTALNFWRKHFCTYTHSLVRRIDENSLTF